MPRYLRTRDGRRDLLLAALALGLVWLAFANSLNGEFVYDDARQIVKNPYIQDTRHFGTALVSDVWAFKGDTDAAWSNYWRPGFVLWLMLNYQTFGLGDSLPWHVSNVLLHSLVVLLAFVLLRRWGADAWSAGAIAAVFALHPTRVESVAWISGSPDLLLALATLGALGLTTEAQRRREAGAPARRTLWLWLAAWLLAGLAMLSKEVGIMIPALVFAALLMSPSLQRRPLRQRLREAGLAALPFLLLAVAYFFARLEIIGQVTRANAQDLGLPEIALSAPALLAFYLRQSVFPLWIGPNYPLRAVMPDTMAADNFWLPLLAVAAFAAMALWTLRRGSFVQRLGLCLFALTLLPAFNIAAFIPEQLVHDRYLYLPLLGLLMMLVPMLFAAVRQLAPGERANLIGFGGVLLLCLPLLWRTVTYNTAWSNELSLWRWAVETDDSSAFNWSQYGVSLREKGQIEDAKRALDRALASLAVSSAPNSLIARAQIARAERRYADAERDLRMVITNQPTNTLAYEELAVVYQQSRRLRDSVQVLDAGRRNAPHFRCAFTTNLAVALYLGGAKQDALNELEAIRPRIDEEANPLCKQAWFRLAQLYAESGRLDESLVAYRNYLDASASYQDANTQQFRKLAQQALGIGSR